MIKFENLKVGDDIYHPATDIHIEIIAVGPSAIAYSSSSLTGVIKKDNWQNDWSYYTPPKKTKQVLMSPAVCFDRNGYYRGYYVENKLFTNEEEAKSFYSHFHSWPAKDGSGRAIEYLVEVEE